MSTPPKNELSTIQSAMIRLDEIAATAALSTEVSTNPFTQAIQTATAIQGIRENLTDAIMSKAILPLMNSKLGFRTDKDPSRPSWNRKSGRMETPEPYPVGVVRECLIEATLRGIPTVGNCFNIIGGNSYITKEGFWFLLRHRVEGLTDFKVSIGVPKMIRPAGDAKTATDDDAKGAVVTCLASWKKNGKPDSIEREIPIRINAMMGTDAIMGKAERKILAAAYSQLTGTTLGDADVTEDDVHHAGGEMKQAKAAPAKAEALTVEASPVEAETPAPVAAQVQSSTEKETLL